MQRHAFIERLEPRVVLNGAPVAVPDPWYTTPQNTTLTVTTQGTTLVANDWDPEGSAISASLVSGPSHGTLTNMQSNGTFTYTPTSGYRGFDSFKYRVSDGSANSNTVEARIAVGGYLGPRTNQDEVSQDLSLLNGSLGVVTPLTPGLNLVCQSDTQSNAIVAVDTSLLSSGGVPSAISAQLTFNGTAGTNYGYSTSGLTPGRGLRFAQQANTSSLATGRYNWQMDVTTTFYGIQTVHSFTGSTNVVNRNSSTAPYGRGWQLAGLDQLVSQTGGMLFVRSDGTTLWFADNGSGGYQSTYRTDRFGRLLQWTDPLSHTTLTERNADGLLIRLTGADPDGTGSATSPVTVSGYDALGNLVYRKNPDGYSATWTYTTAFNRVATAVDEVGEDVSFGYDSAGNLTSATDALGYVTSYTVNSRGLPTSVTTPDPDGTGPLSAAVTSFAYDSYGRMTTITNPDSTTRTFSYNMADMRTGETDELSHTASFVYDSLNRLTSQTDRTNAQSSFVYNALGLLTRQTDALGNVTDLEYNNRGWLTYTYQPDPDGSGPLARPYSTYSYDGVGNLISQGEPNFTGVPLQYVYDAAGRMTSMKYQGDAVATTYEYDNLNRVTKVTDPAYNTVSFVYNWRNQVLQEDRTTAMPPPGGAPTLTQKWEYDPLGQLTAEVDARGYRTSFVWDARGQLLEQWQPDPDGEEPDSQGPAFRTWTRYTCDGQGRLIIETNEAGQWHSYEYNLLGDVSRLRDRNGRVLQFEHDLLGRLTSEQWRNNSDPVPALSIATTAQGGPVNEVQRVGVTSTYLTGGTFTLNYNGQTTAAIAYNATAAQVQSALEALNNIAPGDVVVTKLQDTTSAQEWKLSFQGALGGANLVQSTIDSTNVWAMGGKTEIEATDTQGSSGGSEVQTVTLSNATGGTFRLASAGYVTTPLAYNATAAQVDAALDALASVDNVTVTGNAGGPWTVTFGGSQAGLNVSRMGGDATAVTAGTLVRTLSYTYDAASQLTAASDPDSSYAISYDNLGRVLTVDNNGTSGVPRVILTSAYDVVGNRTSLSASVAGAADFLNTYTHDALDRLTRVDQTGQTGGNTVSEKRVDLVYNALGQYTSIARYKDTDGGTANEVATAGYSYDTLGRLTGLAYTKGGSNLFTPYSWTYDSLSSGGMGFDGSATVSDPRVAATAAAAVFDAMGRITQMVSQDGTSTYGYDSKSQLTSATHSYQSNETYAFDNNGNRTMSGYQTGTDNRLTNDGIYSYTYDAEGNRLTRTKTATGEVTEYTWDYHNRLTKVTEKNSQGTVTQVVEYIYDVFDRRIGRKIDTSAPFDMANAVIERYVLDDIHNGVASADGGNVVLDFVDTDGSGAQAIAMSKRYLYGEAVDQLFAQEDLSKTLGDTSRNLWPLVDHLGTVRDLAKQDGTIATHFKYDSFGNVISGDTSKTRYLFTSRELDTATKLQYNRARYYDAAVGRWISEDPLGFAAGDANVGRYVGNRSTSVLDPSGFDWRKGFPFPFNLIGEWWGELTRDNDYAVPAPPFNGMPYRWPGARPRPVVAPPGSWAPPEAYGPQEPVDNWGLPTKRNDSWHWKDFIKHSMLEPGEIRYACGGMFSVRCGLPPNNPFELIHVDGALAFTDLRAAGDYHATVGGVIGAVRYADGTSFTNPDGSPFVSGPPIDIRYQIDTNAHDFLTLLGTPQAWYWEHANHSFYEPGGEVIHDTRTPSTDPNTSPYAHPYLFFVIPGAPTASPLGVYGTRPQLGNGY